MVLNFRKLCEDNCIEIAPAGYTTVREGWLSITCPFCEDTGYRLGYDETFGYCNCFRCGYHHINQTVAAVLGTNKKQTYEVMQQYEVGSNAVLPKSTKQHASICELPSFTGVLKKPHCDYLRGRKFSPKKLATLWGIKGTTASGSYGSRIIIPITYKGQLISYQGRDITNEAQLRYKACCLENEVINHKDFVYGFDQALPFGKCVVTEGALDVWRLGYGAVCTFGIKWTEAQMRLLAQNFPKVYILYDKEEQANSQAEKLQAELLFRGVDCELLDVLPEGKDPGELPQEQANQIMKGLKFIKWTTKE